MLLYELLTGHPPFDPKRLAQAGFEEILRRIREEEPPGPSTRLVSLQREELTTTDQRRHTEPIKLISLIRGDLDWIVMQCLEKNRTRRYETASALALDVERHLNNEPVTAAAPTLHYRMAKFSQRHRTVLATVNAFALLLSAGPVVSVWQALRATQAERQQSRLREAAQQAQANEAQLRRKAETEELLARQNAYAADMQLVRQALEASNLGRAQDLLNRHRPKSDQQDLRGWEWRYLWQESRSEALFTLCQQTNPILCLAVSPDGAWLAIQPANQPALSVWDLRTRQEAVRLPGAASPHAAFSPRAPLLAFSFATNIAPVNSQHSVRLWDGVAQRIAGELPLESRCLGLAFAADGRTLVAYTTNHLELWRIPEGTRAARYAPPKGYLGFKFAVSPDLSTVAYPAGMSSSRISVADLATGQVRWSASFNGQQIGTLVFYPDSRMLATSLRFTETAIRLWDTVSGEQLKSLEGHRGYVQDPVFWPDGKRLASASVDQTIRIWSLTNLNDVTAPRVLHGHRREVHRLTLLPDLATLASGGRDGAVCLWNTMTPQREDSRIILTNISYWFFGPDSTSLFVQQCDRWFRRMGAGLQQKEPLADLGLAFSPDCRWAAGGSSNGIIRVWDWAHPLAPREFKVGTGEVRAEVFPGQTYRLLFSRQNENVSLSRGFQKETNQGFVVSKRRPSHWGKLEKRMMGRVFGSGLLANTEWWPEGW